MHSNFTSVQKKCVSHYITLFLIRTFADMPHVIVVLDTGHLLTQILLYLWMSVGDNDINMETEVLEQSETSNQTFFFHVGAATDFITLPT